MKFEKGYQAKTFDSLDDPEIEAPVEAHSETAAEATETNADQIVMNNPVLTRMAERNDSLGSKLSSLWTRVQNGAGAAYRSAEDFGAGVMRGVGKAGETVNRGLDVGADWLVTANRKATEGNLAFADSIGEWIGKRGGETASAISAADQNLSELNRNFSKGVADSVRETLVGVKQNVVEFGEGAVWGAQKAREGVAGFFKNAWRQMRLERLKNDAERIKAKIAALEMMKDVANDNKTENEPETQAA